MKYLAFKNDGLLDIMGLLLMGASTKRDDKEKIGEYGTGWKYALAALYRNNVPIHILIDGEMVSITTTPVKMGHKTFQAFRIDNKDAYFTTEMGPDWKLWMAIREVYCNCLDETHPVVSTENDIEINGSVTGKTIVFIGITEDVELIIDNWMDYFCFERTDDVFEIPGKLKIYQKLHSNKSIIYRKGIKVAESSKPGCFDYDFHDVPINEIREADFSEVVDILRRHLINNANAEVISAILSSKDTWEKEINFYGWETMHNKDAWQSAVGKSYVVPEEYTDKYEKETKDIIKEDDNRTILVIPTVMARLISDNIPEVNVLGFIAKGGPLAIPEEIGIEFNEKIAEVLNVFESAGIIKTGEFLVQVCEFSDGYTKSAHNEKLISISNSCRDYSLQQLAVVMLREILLSRTGLRKASTDFETFLLGEIVDAVTGLNH